MKNMWAEKTQLNPDLEKPNLWEKNRTLTPEQGQVEKEKRDRERRNRRRDSSQYSRSGRRTSRNIYNFFNTPAQQEEEEEFERPWHDKTRP